MTRAAGSTMCSQLSKTSSACFRFERASEVLERVAVRRQRDADRLRDGRRRYSRRWTSGASSMNQTPSPDPSSRFAATCSDVRVLPTPPDPTSVTSAMLCDEGGDFGDLRFAADKRRQHAAASCSEERRGNEAAETRLLSRARAVGRLARAARGRAADARQDRASSPAAASAPCTRSVVTPETRTWPPWPIARRRATRLTAGPK